MAQSIVSSFQPDWWRSKSQVLTVPHLATIEQSKLAVQGQKVWLSYQVLLTSHSVLPKLPKSRWTPPNSENRRLDPKVLWVFANAFQSSIFPLVGTRFHQGGNQSEFNFNVPLHQAHWWDAYSALSWIPQPEITQLQSNRTRIEINPSMTYFDQYALILYQYNDHFRFPINYLLIHLKYWHLFFICYLFSELILKSILYMLLFMITFFLVLPQSVVF